MKQKFLERLQSSIGGGALIIAVFSIVSRILGLLRNHFLASSFGAGDVLDTYYAAFKIPDLVFNVLILGALSASFIPVFLEYWSHDKKRTWELTNSVLNILLVSLVVIAGLCFIIAPQLMYLVAPGFSQEKLATAAGLTRIMLASIFFFTLSNVVSGVLNAFRKFFAYSLAPVMYNLGIIFGILVLVPYFGVSGLAWGLVLGAMFHFLVQLPAVLRTGFRYAWRFEFRDSGVKKIFRLMAPRALGLAVQQINLWVITIVASTLMVGSIAVFNLANDLYSFPIGVVGISLAIASFPLLSQAHVEKNMNNFVVHYSQTFRRILYLLIPCSILILLLRAQIVRLILGAGNFDWQDTILTAQTLGYLGLSLFAQGLMPLLARSFYARQDTRTPVIISFISLVLNIFFALILSRSQGVVGLALAYSLASIINMLLLIAVLRLKMGYLDDNRIIKSTIKIILLSLVMGLLVQGIGFRERVYIPGMKYLIGSMVDMRTFIGVFIQTAVSATVGIIFYVFLSFIVKLDEVEIVRQWLKKLIFGKRPEREA